MLGLRRYKNVQIDLWQGDIAVFDVDIAYPFSPDLNIATCCANAESRSARHISLQISDPTRAASDAQLLRPHFERLKAYIDEYAPTKLKRITIVAHNLNVYHEIQSEFFARFEDEKYQESL